MEGGVEHLHDDVERHLDGEGLSGVMGTGVKDAGSLFVRLGTHLKGDERDVSALIGLSSRADLHDAGEFFLKLLNEEENVVVHQVDAELGREGLQLDLVVELGRVHQLGADGLLPFEVLHSLLSVSCE